MSLVNSSKLLKGVSLCRKSPLLSQVANMGSEIWSGSGKGGGSGGRLVDIVIRLTRSTVNKIFDPAEVAQKSGTEIDRTSRSGRKNEHQSNHRLSSIIDLSSNTNSSLNHNSSVREAGGALGKKGAAQEEMYFDKQNKEMKSKLKSHLKEEIKKHEDAIKASKELMKDLEKWSWFEILKEYSYLMKRFES